jgi:vancomycin permeability regulator SanA
VKEWMLSPQRYKHKLVFAVVVVVIAVVVVVVVVVAVDNALSPSVSYKEYSVITTLRYIKVDLVQGSSLFCRQSRFYMC